MRIDINSSDRLNPVFYKELRLLSNTYAGAIQLLALLCIEMLCGALYYFVCDCGDSGDVTAVAGVYAFMVATQLLCSTVPVVYFTTQQRKADGLEPLWGTRLSVRQVITGKLQAILLQDAVLFALSLPLWFFLRDLVCVPEAICAGFGLLAIQCMALALAFYHVDQTKMTMHFWMLAVMPSIPMVIIPAVHGCIGQESPFYGQYEMFIYACLSIMALSLCFAVSFLRHGQRDRDMPPRICILLLVPAWFVICRHYLAPTNSIAVDWAMPVCSALACYMVWCSFGDLLPKRRIARELPKNAMLRCLCLPMVSGAINCAAFSLLLAVAVTFAGWEACRGMLEPQLSCRLYSCILLMEYALFYAGVIVSVRTHMPHLSPSLLVGIIAAINVIPGPISLMLDLPDLNYLSPFYLNWLCAQWHKLTLAGMQLRLLPILLAGLALFAVPACRYARALRSFLTPCEKQ